MTLRRSTITPRGHALLQISYSDGRRADCYVDLAWLRDRADQLADTPRPLTPDAITDEMRIRAWRAMREWENREWSLTHQQAGDMVLRAALTEPTRPEGAERWEDFLIDSLDYQALTDQQIADLADRIAEEMNR